MHINAFQNGKKKFVDWLHNVNEINFNTAMC